MFTFKGLRLFVDGFGSSVLIAKAVLDLCEQKYKPAQFLIKSTGGILVLRNCFQKLHHFLSSQLVLFNCVSSQPPTTLTFTYRSILLADMSTAGHAFTLN